MPTPSTALSIIITSTAFDPGGWVPTQYTCDGADINPPLHFDNIPATTKTLVLTLDDPDSPNGTFSHWIVYNIPPTLQHIPERFTDSAVPQGKNSAGTQQYFGPCPNIGTHRYIFTVYALDTTLTVDAKDKETLDREMDGHILRTGQLLSRYARK